MYYNPTKGVFELLLGLLHLLLMGGFLTHQPANVAVGGLDHGIEVVGVSAVYLPSFHPGQQDTHRLGKFGVVWVEKGKNGGGETDGGMRAEYSVGGEHFSSGTF